MSLDLCFHIYGIHGFEKYYTSSALQIQADKGGSRGNKDPGVWRFEVQLPIGIYVAQEGFYVLVSLLLAAVVYSRNSSDHPLDHLGP